MTPSRAIASTIAILLAGAAANLLVASACALWSPTRPLNAAIPWTDLGIARDLAAAAWGNHAKDPNYVAVRSVTRFEGPGITHTVVTNANHLGGDIPLLGQRPSVHVVECGWPFRAFRCTSVPGAGEPAFPSASPSLPWRGGIPATRPIPLLPIVPGFVINSLLYAVLLALAGSFAALIARRRARRRSRRGLCPRCAYPVGAACTCPECGAAASHARG